jgi:type I restriction enzyme S subunit
MRLKESKFPKVKWKYLAKEKMMYGANESAESEEPSYPRYIRITDLDMEGQLKEETFKSLEWEKAKPYLLQPGDILLARSGATVGKSYIHELDIPSCFAGYLIKFKVDIKKVYPKFVYYFTQTKEYADWISENTIQATIQNVSAEKYANLEMPLPSLFDQQLIISFLDKKTKSINEIIRKKERLITLLEEKRQSMITEAVTKGLKHNKKMMNTGVEWIGEIPEDWNIKKIKYKFTIRKVIHPTNAEPIVLSLTQKGLKIKDLNDFSGQHAESYEKYQRVEINDYVMNGMDLLTGYVDCAKFEGVTSPDYRVFRLMYPEESHDYYLRYFQMCYFSKIFYGHGQGVSNLGRWRLQTDVFKDFPIPEPPINEQFAISNYLNEKEIELNESIELIKCQINNLREYRQSLIYEAVTGKVDVSECEAVS